MQSDFQLGAWRVQPQLNSLVCELRAVRLEPKMMGVLLCLAQRSGDVVSKDQIVQEVWKGTFVTDDVLIRCVSELRKAFGDNAGKPAVIETVPKRGYRLLIRPVSIARENHHETHSTPEVADSIAVLPFENAGPDPDMEYLSDGIAETIINSLSHLKTLRVVPRATAFQYKRKSLDPTQVGRELKARLVLTGHLGRRGDRLLVGAELIDTVRQSQLWGQTYDSKIEEILAIQEEIAGKISNYLELRLTDVEKRQLTRRSTESREAYHLYLRARYFAHKWSPEGFRKGFEYCAQAIEADPAYAEAYTCLAYLYLLVGVFGGAPPVEMFAKSKAAAIRALEIDDGSADAHAALGFVHLVYDWDWQGSEAESRRAIKLAPTFETGHYVYSHYFLARQQFQEAVTEGKLALSIDPLSAKLNYHLGSIYYFSRLYDEAIEQLRKAAEVDPLFVRTHQVLAHAYARKGKCQDALREAEKGLVLSGGSLRSKGLCGGVHAMLGLQLQARNALDELKLASGPPHFVEAYQCAAIHAMLGEHDEAFEWLNKAFQGHSPAIVYMGSDPNLEDLHGDSRFTDLLRRIGLPA
jgi:adenylate cyclase